MGRHANPDTAIEPGVDISRLYEWLERQIESSRRESEENECAANLDLSVGPRYHAEAFAEVRRMMRRFDKSLPRTSADRI